MIYKAFLEALEKGEMFKDLINELSNFDIEHLKKDFDFGFILFNEFPFVDGQRLQILNRLKSYLKKLTRELYSESGGEELIKKKFEVIDIKFANALKTVNRNSSQSWIIDTLDEIKEEDHSQFVTYEGQCFGFSYMALQAITINDTETFKKRINYLSRTPPAIIKKNLEENRLQLIQKAQKEKNYKPTEVELESLELKAFLENLAFVQSPWAFGAAVKQPSTEIKAEVSNPSEFDAFALKDQNYIKSSEFVMSDKLAAQGGLQLVNVLNLNITANNMMIYFRTLRNCIKSNLPCDSFAMSLQSENHQITVGYLSTIDKWIFCDVNSSPSIQEISSDWLIANRTFKAVTPITKSISKVITSEIYSTKSQEPKIDKIYNEWISTPEMSYMMGPEEHTYLNQFKCNILLDDDNNALSFAVCSQKPNLVRLALEDKGRVHPKLIKKVLEFPQAGPEIISLILNSEPNLSVAFCTDLISTILNGGRYQHFLALLNVDHENYQTALQKFPLISWVINKIDKLRRLKFIVDDLDDINKLTPWYEWCNVLIDMPNFSEQSIASGTLFNDLMIFLKQVPAQKAESLLAQTPVQQYYFPTLTNPMIFDFLGYHAPKELAMAFAKSLIAYIDSGGGFSNGVNSDLFNHVATSYHEVTLSILASKNPQIIAELVAIYDNVDRIKYRLFHATRDQKKVYLDTMKTHLSCQSIEKLDSNTQQQIEKQLRQTLSSAIAWDFPDLAKELITSNLIQFLKPEDVLVFRQELQLEDIPLIALKPNQHTFFKEVDSNSSSVSSTVDIKIELKNKRPSPDF